MDVTWDILKADANLANHGVAFADAEAVLADPLALTAEDPDAEGEQRFLTVGADALGRILAVITHTAGRRKSDSSRPVAPPETREGTMRKEYDLHGARRGAVVKDSGKQRITIMLDGDVLSAFRDRAAGTGRGYQTLINQALRDYLANGELEDTLRRVMREELRRTG